MPVQSNPDDDMAAFLRLCDPIDVQTHRYFFLSMIKRKPRLCFVALNAFPILSGDKSVEFAGGAELQQVELAKKLVTRGYSVSMICRDDGQDDGQTIDGVMVVNAYKRQAGLPIFRFVYPRLTALWKSLKRVNADVYYTRTASILPGVVAAFCIRHSRKSIFAGAGNPDFDRKTDKIRFQRDRWIYEYGLKNTDQIVAQNREQVEMCMRNYKRHAALISSIYSIPRIEPQGPPSHILWVSTIREVKRPWLFLELARMLPNYKFKMVGGRDRNESRLYDDIKERAKDQSNVEFLGFVPYREVDKHFDSASLFVNTSSSEGFPNTFLQSWARAVPTVAFIDCGARVNDLPIGLVVKSLAEMASTVARLMENETERSCVGEKCKQYVAREHNSDRILGLYEEIFQKLLETDKAVLSQVP